MEKATTTPREERPETERSGGFDWKPRIRSSKDGRYIEFTFRVPANYNRKVLQSADGIRVALGHVLPPPHQGDRTS